MAVISEDGARHTKYLRSVRLWSHHCKAISISSNYKGIALFSQGEFVFDAHVRPGSFFYTWSELSYAPMEWFGASIVAQRTKAYQTSLSIQRGFLVGLSPGRLDFTTYVFNLGWTGPTVVKALGVRF